MNTTRTRILRGLAAALALAVSMLVLSACGSSGPNADQELGVGPGNTGTSTGTGTSTIGAGNGNSGGNSPYTALSGANTQPITVFDENFYDETGVGYINEPMVSVTICQPGTTTCETIPDILLDTGSDGLRLIASTVSLSLPAVTVGGTPEAECTEYETAFDWGPVVQADVRLGDGAAGAVQDASHTASSVPIQLMGSSTYNAVPTDCSGSGLVETDTVSSFGANGILGIGVFAQDCGSGCTTTVVPAFYYTCATATNCTDSESPISSQVANPARLMPADNNGIIVSLPAVGVGGVITEQGSLAFGINTVANNALGGAQEYATDADGELTSVYNGSSYASFIDTGSNYFYILDSATLGIADCASGTDGYGLYCPANTTNFSMTNEGTNGTTGTVGFSIANGTALVDTGNAVFDDIAAPSSDLVDFGLPFFLGRNVYIGFESLTSPGTGMFFAY